MESPMEWHRYFGLILMDFFIGSPYEVELEKDLSTQQQRIDVIVVRKTPGTMDVALPDGFDNLADHNLISFKSHQEAFTAWTIKELIGHYVSYRKLISPNTTDLLPEEQFRLYGVCARFPTQLAGQVELNQISDGVYQCRWGVDDVRLIVARDLPRHQQNAMLHLFSAAPEQVQYGRSQFSKRDAKTSSLVDELVIRYGNEGIDMSYTLEDYHRERREELLKTLTLEERLKGLAVEERLKGLPVEAIEAYLAAQKKRKKNEDN